VRACSVPSGSQVWLKHASASSPAEPSHPFGNQAAGEHTPTGPWLCAPALRPVCPCRGRRGYRPFFRRDSSGRTSLGERLSGRKGPLLRRRPSGRLAKAGAVASDLHSQAYVTIRRCQTQGFRESGNFPAIGLKLLPNLTFHDRAAGPPGLPQRRSISERCQCHVRLCTSDSRKAATGRRARGPQRGLCSGSRTDAPGSDCAATCGGSIQWHDVVWRPKAHRA
jgi:hypothetical protein